MRGRVGSFSLWAVLIAALFPLAAENKTAAQSADELSETVHLVQLVNRAELNYLHSNGGYATYAELLKSGQLEQTASQSAETLHLFRTLNRPSDSEPLPGFRLRLVVAGDGTAYQLSLTQQTDGCASNLFSDERGMVYEGKTIGCQSQVAVNPSLPTWGPPDVDQAIPPVRTDIPCPLPTLLRRTSGQVEELVTNLQRFSAREQIEHTEVRKNGHPRTPTTSVFNYVAEINQAAAGTPSVEEYRTTLKSEESARVQVFDTGSAAFALIFHPRLIQDYIVTCEGLTDVEAHPAWQVHFAQRPDRANLFHVCRIGNNSYPLKLKGRAWISADNYEIVRLETDLLEPVKRIHLAREHLAIRYGPVQFRKRNVRLWLPQLAELYIDYNGHRYQRRHNFSDFQLFWVEAGQQTKTSVRSQDAGSTNN